MNYVCKLNTTLRRLLKTSLYYCVKHKSLKMMKLLQKVRHRVFWNTV